MFCYNCGKKLPDGAKFCKYCGADLTSQETPAPGPNPNPIPVPVPAPAPKPAPAHVPVPDPAPAPMPEKEIHVSDRMTEYQKTEVLLDDPAPVPPHGNGFNPPPMPQPGNGFNHDKPQMQVTRPPKKKKKWPLVLLLLIIILLSLGVLGALFIFPDKVEEVVDKITGTEKKSAGEDEEDEDEDKEDAEQEDTEGDETEVEAAEEEEAKGPQWAAAYTEAVEALTEKDWPDLSLMDLNGDGTPEIVAVKGDGTGTKTVISVAGDSDSAKSLELGGSALVYSPSNGLILDSYVLSDVSYDVVYELKDGNFTKVFDGACRLDASNMFDAATGDPNIVYTIDGANTDAANYYSNLQYTFFSKGVTDGSEIKTVSYDTMKSLLEEDDPQTEFDSKATVNITPAQTTIGFKATAQFFVAPATGTYRFTLYGANGGGDGNSDYDDEAAVLVGTVNMTAGEKMIVMTGGAGGMCKDYWDFVKNVGTEVPGGFNGGGSCFASGGGGGCTDIYYQGVRVAAAAGAGGGNYDEKGKVGRTSTSSGNTTSAKSGEGRGSVDGGGGGGGWLGGKQGKVDKAGYGGINGWNSNYFTVENEYEGQAFTMSGSRDGSALVEYLGN